METDDQRRLDIIEVLRTLTAYAGLTGEHLLAASLGAVAALYAGGKTGEMVEVLGKLMTEHFPAEMAISEAKVDAIFERMRAGLEGKN
jgi:hypothetical protein